jgi:hypothetical protein
LFAIALYTAAVNAQQQAGTKTAETCSVEGRVIGAIKGEPVRKATLLLMRTGKPQGQSYSAITSSGGSFAMQDLEPGKYRITVMKGGYGRMQYGARSPGHAGTTLSLDAGQRVRDLVIRLTPQAVVTGRILDADGDPVSQVSVQLHRYVYIRGKRRFESWGFANTNDLGEYRLFDLDPGRYYLSALPQDDGSEHAGQGYATTYYPGTTDPTGAGLLDLRAGVPLRGIDIPLMKRRTVTVRGRAILPIKAATAGPANVMLVPQDESRGFVRQSSADLDAQGSFELRGVVPGAYFLMAQWWENTKFFSTRHPIDVSEGDVENIVLELTPSPDLSGQVHVEGRALQSFAELHVTLEPDGGGLMGWPGGQVHHDGRFTISNVSAGQYQLRVQGAFEDYYVKSARLGGRDILDSGIDASRGAVGPLDVWLSSNGGQVEGVVLNAEEQPAPGSIVALVPEPGRRSQPRFYRDVTTDQYGRFQIKGIAPGDYKLFAWEDVESGAYEDPDFLKAFETLGASLVILEGGHESKQLKLIPSETKKR